MLLGNWKNFDELENALSYPELHAMVKAKREAEHREFKFQAALQGVDLDKNNAPEQDPVEQAKLRARARLQNMDPDKLKFQENVTAAGFKVRTA